MPRPSLTGGRKLHPSSNGRKHAAAWTPEKRAVASRVGLKGGAVLHQRKLDRRTATLGDVVKLVATTALPPPTPPPDPPPSSGPTEATRYEVPQGIPVAAGILGDEQIQRAAEAYARYLYNPTAYVEEIILARQLDISVEPHQADLLDALARYDRVAVKAGNGMGKDTTTAWAIEWYLLTHPMAKVPCTSGVFRQVYSMLWSEVQKWSKRSLAAQYLRPLSTRVEVVGYEKEWFAEGFTAQQESEAEGYHAPHLLYCITEAKAVEDQIWRAVFKACTGEGNKIFAQSVPGPKLGNFHKVFTELRKTWKCFSYPAAVKVTRADTGVEEYFPTSRLISKNSVDEKLAYGEDGPLFQAGVLANFISQSDESVIPLDWIELAQQRWVVRKEKDLWGPFIGVGCDVARSGTDRTVLATRFGSAIKELSRFSSQDTMQTAGRVMRVLQHNQGGTAVVDVIGLGAGVVDRLRELKAKVIAFNSSERTPLSDRSGELSFLNMRAFAWWTMRDLLDPRNNADICLPPDDFLTADLVTPRWKVTSSGSIQIEGKDEIKKRLGRSTDDADAVVMAFAGFAFRREANIRWL